MTARIEAKLIASPNPDGREFNLGKPQVKAARSEVDLPNPAGGAIPTLTMSLQGSGSTNNPEATVDQNGNTNFTLTGTGKNGFQAKGLPGPSGTIDFSLDVRISPDGNVGVNRDTSTMKEYPTYAAYSYQLDANGTLQVTRLFVIPEQDIDALQRAQKSIREIESKNR